MALDVVFTHRAVRDLRGLAVIDRSRVLQRLSAFAASPDVVHFDILRLVGSSEGFRLRVGDWRVVFNIIGHAIEVRRIGHRREVQG